MVTIGLVDIPRWFKSWIFFVVINDKNDESVTVVSCN